MSETHGYRIGAVQAITTFRPVGELSLYKPGLVKRWILGRNKIFEGCDISMFSADVVKSAIKQLKRDYPHQMFRFGTFVQDTRTYVAISPEHPNPPDQWMIIAPVVKE